MEIMIAVYFLLIGLCLGSFFNVVGLRLPRNETIVSGRSSCPGCQNQLIWYELIPVFSFLIQRGKCRSCRSKISIIYPLTELLTGLLFMVSYLKIGLDFELITSLLMISMLMIIFVSDITKMVIPNKVLLFFLPLFVLAKIIQPLDPWWSSIAGAFAGAGIIFIIILISRGGMGAGDMKLLGVMGIVLGIENVLLTFFLACLIGALIGGLLLALKIIKRKTPIPFGPYIIAASLITHFYGQPIIDWYLHFLY